MYSWTPPLNLSAKRTSGRSTYPAIAAVGTTGDLLVVWTDYTDDPGEILGRQRLANTGVWSDTLNLSLDSFADEGAALYLDRQGRGHLAWTRRDNAEGTDLVYRQWTAGSWSPAVILDDDPGYHPSPYGLIFTEDMTGTLWLFLTVGSGVRYTRLREGGWAPLTPWAFVPGMRRLGAIAAGDDGLFHVAAFGKNEGNLGPIDPYYEDAYYTTTDGDQWGPLENLAVTGTIAYDVDLVFAGGVLHFLWGDPHPIWSLDSEKSAVYERVLADGAWSERAEVTIPNEDQAIADLALQVDTTGRLHLAWSEGLLDSSGRAIDLSIRYRLWTAGSWGEEEIVFTSTLDSLNVDLALPQGEAAVVWEEGPSVAEEVHFSERRPVYRVFLPRLDRSAGGTKPARWPDLP